MPAEVPKFGKAGWTLEERCHPSLVEEYRIKDADAQKWLELRRRCLTDLYFFSRHVMGRSDFYEPLHRPLCEFVDAADERPERYTVVLVPRGFFKTTVEMDYMLLSLLRNPNERLLLTHGKKDMAVDYLKDMKQSCLQNKMLRWLFPDVIWEDPKRQAPTWLADQISFRRSWENKVPSVCAGGIDAPVTGFHFTKQFDDDVVYEMNSATPEMREKVREFRKNQIAMRQDPATLRIFWFATRWHHEDASQEFVEASEGRGQFVGRSRMFFRAGLQNADGKPDVNGEATFPTRFTKAQLLEDRVDMGSYRWGCHVQNDPTPEGTTYFRLSDIIRFRLNADGHPPIAEPYVVFTAVDPNRSEKTTGDPSAIVTAAITARGHVWVLDVVRGHQTANQLLDDISKQVKKWNPRRVFVEVNNYQHQLIPWAKDKMMDTALFYNVSPVKSTWVQNKMSRILAMQPVTEAHGFHVLEGLDEFVQEMTRWTGKKGDKDDQLDAMSYIYIFGAREKPAEVKEKRRVNYDQAGFVMREAGIPMGDDFEDEDLIVRRSSLYRPGQMMRFR